MSVVRLRLTGRQHAALQAHLFPGDGKEAVAVGLCGRGGTREDELLLVHELQLLTHDDRRRWADRIDWPPTLLESFLRRAAANDFALVKVHSHPGGLRAFSATDDRSDRNLFESVFGWTDSDRPHGSAIMLPGGEMIGRAVCPGGTFLPIRTIAIAGDDMRYWFCDDRRQDVHVPDFAERHRQLFGAGTTALLGRLRIAVVGCSGTGSPVVEQLARLGAGELLLVDPDRVETRNLNRIVGASVEDAASGALKVDVLARNVARMGLGTAVRAFPTMISDPETRRAVALADAVIGCMDSISGRHVLSRLAQYYLLPYIDVGVKLEALSDGAINQVAGTVHYLQPDGLDFLDRGVFSAAALEAEDLYNADPAEYRERLERGYVRGVQVDRPAVISVNMLFASLAVNELLARLHPFRLDENAEFAGLCLSLSHFQMEREPDRPCSTRFLKGVGRGDANPPLGMPSLATRASEDSP